MYIKQAWSKDFSFIKYLPIPLLFLLLMLLNYAAVSLLHIDVDEVLRQEIARKGPNRVFFETLLPLCIGLILLFLYVRYIHHQTIRSLTTSRPKIDWSRIFFAFFLWGAITAVVTLFYYFAEPGNYVINFKPIPFAILAVLAIIMIPMQTSFEEYLFRGYLMQGLGIATKSRLIPLITTSIIFGLMHIANPEVGKIGMILLIYYVGTGFFLGVITLMDEGLELALGYHAANNLVTALLVTADWTAFQTPSVFKDVSEPTAGYDILFPLLVIYPILLLIFSKKYNWTSWRERLAGKIVLPSEYINKPPHNYEP